VRYFPRFANEVNARGVTTIYAYFPDSFASGAMPYDPLRANVLQKTQVIQDNKNQKNQGGFYNVLVIVMVVILV
jgi:hypothetical protein